MQARDLGYTYRNDVFDSGGFWNALPDVGSRHMLEDISFTPGPWSNVTTTYSISRILFVLYHVSTAQVPAQVQYKFWRAADCSFTGYSGAGTSMINPTATSVLSVTVTLPGTGFDANVGQGFLPVDFTAFSLPAGNYFVEGRILNPATVRRPGAGYLEVSGVFRLKRPAGGHDSGQPVHRRLYRGQRRG